ncbi:Uncharacterized protein PBTT_09957 [Plasmodiophora brassicae]|uniref:Uncharacterized protein n=1 Tax=Plasmodiophora brassicae TaxID=37360 RepID=A0A0G4J113_PLABS|nr:hypothetical protein PBRA_001851 [Plasmodiophora brassicae]SPR01285.1 unnamed protein product [Plasmodiophora brassicae]
MWRRVVRAFSTRSRRARQERLQGQDEQALDYVANRKFAKSLEHAPSVAALHETVRREVEADGLDSRLMTPRNVSMIVYRVGQLHHLLGDAHDDGFRNMVVDLVDRNMLKFMTPSLSSLIRSIGDWSLWEKPPGLCTQIARHLFVQPKLRAPTLCRALPGMATVGVTDDDIWNNALKCFQLQLPHMNGDQLSPCLHAVVRTGRGDVDFFTVMSNHVKLRAFSYDSRCVGQLSMSFARAKDRCPDLTSLFDHLAQQALRQLPMYGTLDLRDVTRAFVIVSPGKKELFDAIANRVVACSDRFSPTVLLDVYRALKSVGVSNDALDEVCGKVTPADPSPFASAQQ